MEHHFSVISDWFWVVFGLFYPGFDKALSHVHSWCVGGCLVFSESHNPNTMKIPLLEDFVTFSKPVLLMGTNTKPSWLEIQQFHIFLQMRKLSWWIFLLFWLFLTSFFSSSNLHLLKYPLELIKIKHSGRKAGKIISLGAWRDFGGAESFIHRKRRRLWKDSLSHSCNSER